MKFDIIIKGASILDGSGGPPYTADTAIRNGVIVAIEPLLEDDAIEIIDAKGKILTPGFIDVHTHYDGQVTWDEAMLPSAAHGITTVLIGCCGIGFAPVRKNAEDWLVKLTEGVEDIPGSALSVGIPWGWESFPEYLDALAKREYALNIAAHVPHSAVRAYVMGQRAESDPPATDEELERICAIVHDAIAAGAFGVGTSRVSMHRGSDGSIVPGTRAPEAELIAIAHAMREAGGGLLQIIPSGVVGGVEGEEGEQSLAGFENRRDAFKLTDEIERMRRIYRETGQPITFTFAESRTLGREQFDAARRLIIEAAESGEQIFPQYSPRQVGTVSNLESYHAFTARPTYRLLAHLPLEERVRRMADPEVKAAILSEQDIDPGTENPMHHIHTTFQRRLEDMFDLGPDLDFEPLPSQSIANRAMAEGRDPLDLLYDLLISDNGHKILFRFATNYVNGNLDTVADMIEDPKYLLGLGDAGAHVCFICDAGYPTFVLSHWGKTRSRGRRIPLELLVRRMTSDPAKIYALRDRGLVQVGMRADLNLINLPSLRLKPMHLATDLPLNASRFLQEAEGFELTMVDGVITRRNDTDTGARPGRLLRRKAMAPGHLARGDERSF